jgi:hypothetical protein
MAPANIDFDESDIDTVGTLMTAAVNNGWIVTTGALSTADWALMAVTPVGIYYTPTLADTLFEL